MNISKSYKEEMLAILEKFKNFFPQGLSSNTVGHAVSSSGSYGGSNAGSCGGFMQNLYNTAGKDGHARNYWPTPSPAEAKQYMSHNDYEKMVKLWIQMMGEIMIPIRYVGMFKLADVDIPSALKRSVESSSRYETLFVTEHDVANYISPVHFKMAHTAIRYLFRRDMMESAYHTMKMKLENPNITVLDCLIVSSYYCKRYYSPMMLFRDYASNIVIDKGSIIYNRGSQNYGALPLPRNRGEIARQLLNESKGIGNSHYLTSVYTSVYNIEKGDTKAREFQENFCFNFKQDSGTFKVPTYLETLRQLREFSVEKERVKKAIVV